MTDFFWYEFIGIWTGLGVFGIIAFKLWKKAFKSWNESGDGEKPVNGSVNQ